MAKKTFGEIKVWDGTSGTGADARAVIKSNFDKVNEGFGEIAAPVLTPKADVATFAALATTYPAPAFGWGAKVTADGLVYTWNDTKWASTGMNSFPSDVALKSELSTLKLEPSTNVLNKTTETPSKFITSTGTLGDGEITYAASDYIKWGSGTNIVSGKNGVLVNFFSGAQYDANKTFIPGSYISYTIPTNTMAKVAGAVYFRLSYLTAAINQVNYGTSILAYSQNYIKIEKDKSDVPVLFKPNINDADLLANFAATSSIVPKSDLVLLQQNGGLSFVVNHKIAPTGTPWSAASSFNNKWMQIHYKGITNKIINRISIPIVRNLNANTTFTDGIVVKIFKAGVLIISKTIAFSELAEYNLLTAASSVELFYYNIDVFPFLIKTDEILFIGAECIAATDKMGMIFKMNTVNDTTEWGRNYTKDGSTANTIINMVAPPALPVSEAFYRVVRFSFCDYITPSLTVKTDESIVAPTKIYTICNDIKQTNEGFDARNYAACLYADHFLKLTTKKSIKFGSTKSDKLPLFAPIATDNTTYNGGVNVKTTTVTDTLTGDINDVDLSISHISTKASLSAAQFPKILCIGDSVTNGFLSDNPSLLTLNNPTAYWSYIKKFFELDKIDAGSGHQALLLGKLTSRSFVVGGNTIKAYAEGRGGWTTRNYLYDASYGGYTNYFYDSAKTGVMFSLAKYLSNYKTLADDGVTRLTVGSTAGALVTDVNTSDVCTPTHVVIQLGFNDVEANYLTDIALMIASIKAEFPNMIVIVSTIDAAGTYFAENYPMFDASAVNLLGDTLHAKMWNLATGAKALENVGNKIFYCPNYFIQPTAWGVAQRNVDFPESLANNQFIFKAEHGAGNEYHPNTYAHAAWGYQLYALIKYTLTL